MLTGDSKLWYGQTASSLAVIINAGNTHYFWWLIMIMSWMSCWKSLFQLVADSQEMKIRWEVIVKMKLS